MRVRREEQFEARRQHANNLRTIGRVVLHGVAQNSVIASKTALPVFVAQNRNGGKSWRWRGACCCRSSRRRGLRLAFGIVKIAAQCYPCAQQPEEIRGDLGKMNLLRSPVRSRDIVAECNHSGEVFEHSLRSVAQINEVLIRHLLIDDVAGSHVAAGQHQPVRATIWKRTKQHGVGHAEYRGARADAQRDGHSGGDQEDRTFAQSARGIPEIFS